MLRKASVQYQVVCNVKEGVEPINASCEACYFLPVFPPPLQGHTRWFNTSAYS